MNEILQLRNEYISCLKLANETDSKKEDFLLRKESGEILSKLRKVCQHIETVCLRSEYEGSYTMDYDNHHPEDRVCLCCGIIESAYENKFIKLTSIPIARFECGFYSDKLPAQLKEPFKFLLSEIKDFAIEKGYRYFNRRQIFASSTD